MLKIAWSDLYSLPLPPGHRFPMIKYELIPEQLLHEGSIDKDNLFTPGNEEKYIYEVHDPEYISRLKKGQMTRQEMRRIGFPYSRKMMDREINIMNGTCQAADFALEYGVAMNVAGGTHHAYRNRGEGFCILNDLAVAANYLLRYKKIRQVLVVDLDVHQGNGTAAIFENRPEVFTFSMHGRNNYPLKKERSDLDIPLEDDTEDGEYLTILQEQLPRLTDRIKPDFILYQSGVDILYSDKLGRLNLSLEGIHERDRIVLEQAWKYQIPITATMGGGYSKSIRDIVEAHCNLYRLALQMW